MRVSSGTLDTYCTFLCIDIPFCYALPIFLALVSAVDDTSTITMH